VNINVLKIPTAGRLTSWLQYASSGGRENDLSPGLPDYKFSNLTTRPRRLHEVKQKLNSYESYFHLSIFIYPDPSMARDIKFNGVNVRSVSNLIKTLRF